MKYTDVFICEIDAIMGGDVSKEIQGARTKSDCGRLEAMRDIRVEMGGGLRLVPN